MKQQVSDPGRGLVPATSTSFNYIFIIHLIHFSSSIKLWSLVTGLNVTGNISPYFGNIGQNVPGQNGPSKKNPHALKYGIRQKKSQAKTCPVMKSPKVT